MSRASPPLDSGRESPALERIQCIARVRPFLDREKDEGDEPAVFVRGNTVSLQNPVTAMPATYRMDAILGAESEQGDVFDLIRPNVDAALAGYNTTVFAYGQTGTGKTHTMLGVNMWELAEEAQARAVARAPKTPGGRLAGPVEADSGVISSLMEFSGEYHPSWGIIPRSMACIFRSLGVVSGPGSPELSGVGGRSSPRRRGRLPAGVTVTVSYLEIYNEKVFDLLAVGKDKGGGGLEIVQDVHGGVMVPEAVVVSVETEAEVLELLWEGARNRLLASTDMNEHSSRSHTIWQVNIERRVRREDGRGDGEEETIVRRSKMNLVDLAGSEKIRVHRIDELSDRRVAELTSINQSLSALGNCVRALADSKRSHIPYRDSKLTRLLQDSLGGNCRTTFVVTVSPGEASVEETLSTLQFADRAKRVEVRARKNETLDDASLARRLQREVRRLKKELSSLKTSSTSTSTTSSSSVAAEFAAEAAAAKEESIHWREEALRCRRDAARMRTLVGALPWRGKARLHIAGVAMSDLEKWAQEQAGDVKIEEKDWEVEEKEEFGTSFAFAAKTSKSSKSSKSSKKFSGTATLHVPVQGLEVLSRSLFDAFPDVHVAPASASEVDGTGLSHWVGESLEQAERDVRRIDAARERAVAVAKHVTWLRGLPASASDGADVSIEMMDKLKLLESTVARLQTEVVDVRSAFLEDATLLQQALDRRNEEAITHLQTLISSLPPSSSSSTPPEDQEADEWTHHVDKRLGRSYWCYRPTNTTQWERPAALDTPSQRARRRETAKSVDHFRGQLTRLFKAVSDELANQITEIATHAKSNPAKLTHDLKEETLRYQTETVAALEREVTLLAASLGLR